MKQDQFIKRSLNALKQSGCRTTGTRRLVLELLAESAKALTPQAIQSGIVGRGKSIDLASVYRILEVLSGLKLIHRDQNEGGYFPCSHCERCPEEVHIFVNCKSCGNLEELDYHDQVFAGSFQSRLAELGITPSQQTIYLNNFCSSCVSTS